MQLSLDAMMSSIVIESWIAFETLASSLWRVAVNEGPIEIVQRVKLATHGKSDSKSSEQEADGWSRDPRKDYAGSFIESGVVSFRRLDRITYWYGVALGDKGIFRDHKDIHGLHAYRNALVHNGGKVDRDFIRQIEPVSDLRGTFKLDEKLLLDGARVARLRNAALLIGTKLIKTVDEYFTPEAQF
jgi:hypothetical protein